MDYLYHTFEGLGGWEVKPVDVERLKRVVALAKKYGYKEVTSTGSTKPKVIDLRRHDLSLKRSTRQVARSLWPV